MSAHLLHVEIDTGWVGVSLSCEHDPADEAWFGYDGEASDVATEQPRIEECWVKSWADEGVEEMLAGTWPDDPELPCSVRAEFDGDCCRIFYDGAES